MTSAGTILADRYRLVRQLGRGGMGSVWVAEHLSLRSQVAIKLIDPLIAESPEALARFMREAQASAALRSPHVVQVLDYGVHAGIPFIAMELLEGESLGSRLQRVRRLSPLDTSRIFDQVARAMSRAHEAGIVHRDLKPDNIFLVGNDDDEVAKVLDFGIAKAHTHAGGEGFQTTRTGAMLGTPYYMSPEQTEGSKTIDHRADIWSMGVIGFECITSIRPFDGETLGGIIMAICGRPIVVPSTVADVPPGFDEWFQRSTARDPRERFSSAKEQAAALRQVCLGQGVRSLAGADGACVRGVPAVSSAEMATTGGFGVHTVSSADLTTSMAERRSRASVGPVLGLLAIFFLGALAGGYYFIFARNAEPSVASVLPERSAPTARALASAAPSTNDVAVPAAAPPAIASSAAGIAEGLPPASPVSSAASAAPEVSASAMEVPVAAPRRPAAAAVPSVPRRPAEAVPASAPALPPAPVVPTQRRPRENASIY